MYIKSLCGVKVVDNPKHLGGRRRFQPAGIFPFLLSRHLHTLRLGLGLPLLDPRRLPIIWDFCVRWVSTALVGGGRVIRVSSQAFPALHPQVLVHLVDAGHQVVLQDCSSGHCMQVLKSSFWSSLRWQKILLTRYNCCWFENFLCLYCRCFMGCNINW